MRSPAWAVGLILLVCGAGRAQAQLAPAADPGSPPVLPPAAPAPAPAPAPAASVPAASPDAPKGEATTPAAAAWVPRPRALPAEAPSAPQQTTRWWRAFGAMRLVASLVQNDPTVAFIGRDDGFDLQTLRAGARGQLSPRARFELSIDGAVDERDQRDAANGRLRLGLRDAFADLSLAGSLALRAGRFEPWLDPDVHGEDTERAFIDRPLSTRGVRATEGWQAHGLSPGRSLGIALRRSGAQTAPGWAAEVAAQNGASDFASDNDNDALALSVAARAWAPALGWIQLAVRYNPRTEGDLPFLHDEDDLGGALGAGARLGPVELVAAGLVVRTTFATTGGPAQLAWGAHGQALWRGAIFGLPIAAGYRFAVLDPSSLVLSDRVTEHTLGTSLDLPSLSARAQLGVVHAVEQAGRTLRNDRVEAALEVSL